MLLAEGPDAHGLVGRRHDRGVPGSSKREDRRAQACARFQGVPAGLDRAIDEVEHEGEAPESPRMSDKRDYVNRAGSGF